VLVVMPVRSQNSAPQPVLAVAKPTATAMNRAAFCVFL